MGTTIIPTLQMKNRGRQKLGTWLKLTWIVSSGARSQSPEPTLLITTNVALQDTFCVQVPVHEVLVLKK